MKGPSERVKYDLRRLWECPVCKRRERTSFTVTFRHCGCQMKQLEGKPAVMKLLADGVRRIGPPLRVPAPAIESLLEPVAVADHTPSDEPAADATPIAIETPPVDPVAQSVNGES